MRVWVSVGVALALASCGDRSASTTSSAAASTPAPSASAAASGASAVVEVPNVNDIRSTFKALGYTGVPSTMAFNDDYSITAEAPDGRKAEVEVEPKPGGKVEPGAIVVPTKSGRVTAKVTKSDVPDAAETKKLAAAIAEGSGKTPRAFEIKPAAPPPWKLSEMVTGEKVKPLLEGMGYVTDTIATMGADLDPGGHVDGNKAGHWAHLDVRCSSQPQKLEKQDAGEAIYFDGNCLMAVGARKDSMSGETAPEEARRILEGVLAAK